MSEAAAQAYTLFGIPEPRQRLVHVHADANEIGRNYHPTLGVVATTPEFCASLEGVHALASGRQPTLEHVSLNLFAILAALVVIMPILLQSKRQRGLSGVHP